jgi:hypothetical protein
VLMRPIIFYCALAMGHFRSALQRKVSPRLLNTPRSRHDVIDLYPEVVHIMGGGNDILDETWSGGSQYGPDACENLLTMTCSLRRRGQPFPRNGPTRHSTSRRPAFSTRRPWGSGTHPWAAGTS